MSFVNFTHERIVNSDCCWALHFDIGTLCTGALINVVFNDKIWYQSNSFVVVPRCHKQRFIGRYDLTQLLRRDHRSSSNPFHLESDIYLSAVL